ncbi:MAG: solute carrier family 26 protein [Balneolales bacterium]
MKKTPTSLFPIFDKLSDYRLSDFKGDLNAGVTVGIILIPQGMAYAVLTGLPPVYGLYAALVPLVLYGIFGTSRELGYGPVALVSLLVFAGISGFAEPGTERFIRMAILTALGVGVVQLLMGVMRMGFLVNFLSHPVLSGFVSAAAIIIGISQIDYLLGMDLPATQLVHQILMELVQNIGSIHIPTALIGLGALVALIVLDKWSKKIPAAVMVVIAGIVVVRSMGLGEQGVSIVGDIPEGLPSFNVDFLSLADAQLLLPTILVVAIVSYIGTIAVSKAIANQKGYKIDANQELIALGAANIGGAFFQSFPTSGSFSRTAVNSQAGSKSGISNLVSAIIISLFLLFLTPLFYYLPSAVLGAIIMMAVASLFDHKEMIYLWKTDKKDFSMLAVTFIATLAMGIEAGIGVGVVTSLAMVIYNSTKPHSTEMGRLGNSSTFRNVKRFPDAHVDERILIYRFDSPLYFANVENFIDTIEYLIEKRTQKGDRIRYFILDASVISWVDTVGIQAMKELCEDLGNRGIELRLSSVRGPVRDKFEISGVTDQIGRDHFYDDVADAVDACGVES